MRHNSIIALEGLPVIGIFAAIAATLWITGWYKAALIMTALAVFAISFFRNPERHPPAGDGIVISPADGTVVYVGEVDEPRILKRRAVKVSIFMSVFNVHVNRMPESGRITEIHYNKGKFISANKEKSSLENEQNALVMETEKGGNIMFVQIAGLVARRIVCWVKPGDVLSRGDRFGLIMFGSRLDVYLPSGSEVRVKSGDKTRAGETIVGVLS
ncbi:MAG: phosphatidylserine decarboxylase family protein [Nitrospirota bacterium]